jgi:hypothetical protein
MIPAIASTTIVSLASLRFNEFDRAYRRYRQRQNELTRLAANSSMPLILLEQPLLLPSVIPAGNLLGHLACEVARMFLEYCHQLRSFRLRALGERLWKQ